MSENLEIAGSSNDIATNTIPDVTTSSIIQDLHSGFTRTPSHKDYDPNIGSIQEKYGLNESQVKALFAHSALKNARTRKREVTTDLPFNLVDDLNENND